MCNCGHQHLELLTKASTPIEKEQESIHRLQTPFETALQKEFLLSVAVLQGVVTRKRLIEAVRAGKSPFKTKELRDAFENLTNNISDATIAAAYQGINDLPTKKARSIEYDPLDPGTVKSIAEHNREMVGNLSKETQKGLNYSFAQAKKDGLKNAVIPGYMLPMIGLTYPQSKSLTALRRDLIEEEASSSFIKGRIKKESGLKVGFRAENVGITETTESMSGGRSDLWRQAKDQGLIEDVEYQRVWVTSTDERVCPICRPLHLERADIGESFEGGYQKPPAHPRCRCSEVLRPRIN